MDKDVYTISIKLLALVLLVFSSVDRERGEGRRELQKYQKDRAAVPGQTVQSSRSHAVITRRGCCSSCWLPALCRLLSSVKAEGVSSWVESVRHIFTPITISESRWIIGTGRDHLGHCVPSGWRISMTMWPLLTWGSKRQAKRLWTDLYEGSWPLVTLYTYSGACWYWIGLNFSVYIYLFTVIRRKLTADDLSRRTDLITIDLWP